MNQYVGPIKAMVENAVRGEPAHFEFGGAHPRAVHARPRHRGPRGRDARRPRRRRPDLLRLHGRRDGDHDRGGADRARARSRRRRRDRRGALRGGEARRRTAGASSRSRTRGPSSAGSRSTRRSATASPSTSSTIGPSSKRPDDVRRRRPAGRRDRAEVIAEAVRVLGRVGELSGGEVGLRLETFAVGAGAWRRSGEAVAEDVYAACEAADAILLGAAGLPDARHPDGREAGTDVIFRLRFGLDLYAGIRPVRLYAGRAHAAARDPGRDRLRDRARERRRASTPAGTGAAGWRARSPPTRASSRGPARAGSSRRPSRWPRRARGNGTGAAAAGHLRRQGERAALRTRSSARSHPRSPHGTRTSRFERDLRRRRGSLPRAAARDVRRHRHGEHVRRHPLRPRRRH